MLRSIGAVLLGYVFFWVLLLVFAFGYALYLEGHLPDPDAKAGSATLVVCVTYIIVGNVLAVASGYVTAWVARGREVAHARGLAGFMFVVGLFYVYARVTAAETPEPLWYVLVQQFAPLVTVPLGGMLRARHVRARSLDAPLDAKAPSVV